MNGWWRERKDSRESGGGGANIAIPPWGAGAGASSDVCCHVFAELLPGGAGFLDRAGVLDGRDVAGVAIEDDGFEDATHDLAAAGLGQHAHEVDLADDGHRPQ